MKTMLRKTIAALFITLLPAIAGAQLMEKYPGIAFTKLSNKGRYLVSSANRVVIFDRQELKTYQYSSGYNIGLGNAVSDTGIIVGAAENDSKPCYWKDGEWHILPHDIPGNPTFAMANGITSDGTCIVGYIDCRAATKKAWPMVSPVMWTLDEKSGEYVFHMLPEPDKDITGRCAPQQVSATYISNDGKTALGQVTDYRGMLEYQIVYNQGPDGNWSYKISGDDRMIKPNAVWPEYPERPAKVLPEDYLTDEEKAAFNEANQAYLDSLEIVSLTGKNPRMPFYEEFIKERREEYEAAVKKFNEDSESYVTRLYAFFDAYAANITNHRYEFNSHKLSSNGKYYTCNYIYPDPEDKNPDVTKVKMFLSPILFDLSGNNDPQVTVNVSMNTYTVSDNGCVAAAMPKNDDKVYSRTSYLIRPGEEPVLFSSWIKNNYPEVQEWLEENMTYTVPEGCDQEAGPQVLYGTVRMTPDETKLISYAIDPETEQYVTYFVDLDRGAGIEPTDIDRAPGLIYDSTSGLITLCGEADRLDIFGISGERVYSANTPAQTVNIKELVGQGIYVVRLSGKGGIKTSKIIVK